MVYVCTYACGTFCVHISSFSTVPQFRGSPWPKGSSKAHRNLPPWIIHWVSVHIISSFTQIRNMHAHVRTCVPTYVRMNVGACDWNAMWVRKCLEGMNACGNVWSQSFHFARDGDGTANCPPDALAISYTSAIPVAHYPHVFSTCWHSHVAECPYRKHAHQMQSTFRWRSPLPWRSSFLFPSYVAWPSLAKLMLSLGLAWQEETWSKVQRCVCVL